MEIHKSLQSKIEFAALCFFILVSLFLSIFAYAFGGVDFGVYYAAGRVLLQGGNPYDYSQLAGEIISSSGELNNPFYYAPWFAWGMSILALLDYETARICWAILNVVLWFCGLFNLSKLIEWPLISWRKWGMYLFATIVFAWSTWGSEQVGVLILFLLTLILLAHQKGNIFLTGFYMALILFKPNITAFPVAILSLWFLFQKQWKPILSFIGSLVILVMISLLISPNWYLALLQPDKLTGLSYTLNEAGEVQTLRYATTLIDWLAAYGVTGNLAYWFYALSALIGLVFIVWYSKKSKEIIALASFSILVNFALIPYALFYDYSLLVLTLFFVNLKLSLIPAFAWLQRLMNILIFASLFVGGNISYRYWIVVILIAVVVVGKLFSVSEEKVAVSGAIF